MGWLRDLMATSGTRVKSLGRLASIALEQADWPSEVSIQARSLAALLGKLDRGQELGWLSARPPVQIILARVLGVSLESVAQSVRATEGAQLDPRLLRLEALPGARPLDLWNEGLPPGLPVLDAAANRTACWWIAPSGSGRTLMGMWLAARGRARFVQPGLATFEDQDPRAPAFVELETCVPANAVPRARPGLVVAAPFEPPEGSGFEVVHAPALMDVLDPLLAWAFERLLASTHLGSERVREFLRERCLNHDARTFGALLGVIGLLSEHGARAPESRTYERLARRHVEDRLAQALDPSVPQSSFLRRNGFDALVGLVERTLVDSGSVVSEPRGPDAWLELVPHELERGIDVDWVRLSLRGVDSGVRPSELERAARKLPPGAYRLLTALEQAGFLRRRGDDRLKLEPAWLVDLLERKAVAALVGRSAVEWGAALLRPQTACLLTFALFERAVARGTAVFEPVLDLTPSDEPEYAATIDAALRVAGIARLLGADISQETLDALWTEARALLITLGDEPPRSPLEPRLPPLARFGQSSADYALFSRGTLYLAALSVSETLAPERQPALRALAPWNATEPPPGLARVYDAIASSLAERPTWYLPALELVGRVRSSVGNAGGANAPHELELVAEVIDEVEHGVLTLSAFERGAPNLEAVLSLGKARGLSQERLADAVWSAWSEGGTPASLLFERGSEWARLLFTHASPASVVRFLEARSAAEIPFESLNPVAFRAVAERPEILCERAALLCMPEACFESLAPLPVARASLAPAYDLVWLRAPGAAGRGLREEIEAGTSARIQVLREMLELTPESLVPQAVAALAPGDWLFSLVEPSLDTVRRALSTWSGSRGAGWREAYALLRRIERERRQSA